MKNKNPIIITILTMIIILLLAYIVVDNNKINKDKVWCNTQESLGVITGEIISVFKNELLIKNGDSDDSIKVLHNSEIKYKAGQKVKVILGSLTDSIPKQAVAICIELIN